jgi:2-iminobutanoate/2-iminopropanoate deaminase
MTMVPLRPALALLTLAGVVACAGAPARPAPEYFPMSGGGRQLPFSAAVRVGSMLYLSGQIGTDSALRLVPGGIGPETRQTMENIRAVLARSGATLDDVIRCTVMMADMREWGAMNQVYAGFFPRHRPARSAFGATGLALGARVEIECLAVAPSSD